MGRVKEYMFELREAEADAWARSRLDNEDVDEESEEYQSAVQDYWDWQEYLSDKAEFEAELEWLKDTGSYHIHQGFIRQLDELKKFAEDGEGAFGAMKAKMVFSHSVTLLETYLSDTSKMLISSSDAFFENALRNVDELKGAKYSLASLAAEPLTPRERAMKELGKILYHNLRKVKRVIEGTLGTRVEVDIGFLVGVVMKRHDIVHRNGRTNDGGITDVSLEECLTVIDEMKTFSGSLQRRINEVEESLLDDEPL